MTQNSPAAVPFSRYRNFQWDLSGPDAIWTMFPDIRCHSFWCVQTVDISADQIIAQICPHSLCRVAWVCGPILKCQPKRHDLNVAKVQCDWWASLNYLQMEEKWEFELLMCYGTSTQAHTHTRVERRPCDFVFFKYYRFFLLAYLVSVFLECLKTVKIDILS